MLDTLVSIYRNKMSAFQAVDNEPDFALAAPKVKLPFRRNNLWDTNVCISKSIFLLLNEQFPSKFPSDNVPYKLTYVMRGLNTYMFRKVQQNTIFKSTSGQSVHYQCINDPISEVLGAHNFSQKELMQRLLFHCLALEYVTPDESII